MIIKGMEAEREGLLTVAKLMCVAARTAPKGKGLDNLETLIVAGEEEKDALSREMQKLFEETNAGLYARDAENIKAAGAIVLIGTRLASMGIPGCGYCGYGNCAEKEKSGGLCAFAAGDLGIAIGSAVAVAARFHVDNRIMYTVGRAAIRIGLFSPEVKIAYGIPLSVSGKNPFFDRPSKKNQPQNQG